MVSNDLMIVIFVLWGIFTCIATTRSESYLIQEACGDKLRGLLMSALVISWAFGICLVPFVFGMDENKIPVIARRILAIALFILFLILGSFTISASADALSNTACFDAMISKDEGIYSPSANTGIPLIAIIGAVDGVVFFISGLWIFNMLMRDRRYWDGDSGADVGSLPA